MAKLTEKDVTDTITLKKPRMRVDKDGTRTPPFIFYFEDDEYLITATCSKSVALEILNHDPDKSFDLSAVDFKARFDTFEVTRKADGEKYKNEKLRVR